MSIQRTRRDRTHFFVRGCLIVIALLLMTVVITTADSSSSSSSSPSTKVHVTNVTMDPEVFYPDEEGTVIVEIQNSGNESVGFFHATILDKDITILNPNSYDALMFIGPSSKMTFTFLVKADAPDGTYLPIFSLGFKDTGSIRYPFKVIIESADLKMSVIDKPDTFPLEKKSTIQLSLVNPRDGPLKDILVVPAANGIDITPTQYYLTTLEPTTSKDLSFQVTPHASETITFNVTYRNGNNIHSTQFFFPIVTGEDKMQVQPVINNIVVTQSGQYCTLKGDVSNAGINDARSMVVTAEAPYAVEPSRTYTIGTLDSGDFSTFEITIANRDLTSVPIVIQWKDASGNTFSQAFPLDLRSLVGGGVAGNGATSSTRQTAGGQRGGMFGMFGGGGGGIASFYPLIIGGILIVIGVVLWKKRSSVTRLIKRH